MSERHLRGSHLKCPKCGSGNIGFDPAMTFKGYGPGLASCANPACRALWEYFDPAAIWDPTDPVCSFKEPCNNCAFRKGSPEQEDRESWQKLLDQCALDGTFYCHKGVPIEPDAEHGFAYPYKDGEPDRRKLRICRGYLNFTFSQNAEKRRAAAEPEAQP